MLHITITVLWPLYRTTCVTCHPCKEPEDFVKTSFKLVTCRYSGREADALKIHILTPIIQPLLEHDDRGSLNNRSR